VLDRCERVSGDFLAALPEGADAYVLVNILHDWDDDTATRILRSCRRAMSDEARLVVIDYLVPVDQEPHHAKGMDMLMLMFTGGRERTQAELEELLGRANLLLITVRSAPRSLSKCGGSGSSALAGCSGTQRPVWTVAQRSRALPPLSMAAWSAVPEPTTAGKAVRTAVADRRSA
jgi:hypothetical protein